MYLLGPMEDRRAGFVRYNTEVDCTLPGTIVQYVCTGHYFENEWTLLGRIIQYTALDIISPLRRIIFTAGRRLIIRYMSGWMIYILTYDIFT